MGFRARGHASGERGSTLPEVMVVCVILGILATVTTFIITAVFNANIQGGQFLNQQQTIQTAENYFNNRLTPADVGAVGQLTSDGSAISKASIAGDQFTFVTDGKCYRIFYLAQAKAIESATQDVDGATGKCKAAGSGGISPVLGPNQGGSMAADPVLNAMDLTTGAVTGSLPSGATVFTLASNVQQLSGTSMPIFSFRDANGASTINVESTAGDTTTCPKVGGTPDCSWYNTPSNLDTVASVLLSAGVMGAPAGTTPNVGTKTLSQEFFLASAGSSGTSGTAGTSANGGLASRVATNGALASNTLSSNTLTASSGGALAAIDGVSVSPGDRVLVKDEASGAKNGLYQVTSLGSNTIPGTPAVSGEVGSYSPNLYWSQMGTNLTDASGYGRAGSWGSATYGGTCPTGTTSSAIQSVTGQSGSGGWGGQMTSWSGVSYPTYTNDSPVAKVAVHAGIIAAGQTANVRVCQLPGLSAYTGSAKNGVTTSNYGAWSGSIVIVAAPMQAGPAGVSATGFDSWNASPHNATQTDGSQYITSTYNNLWDANGGAATLIMGVYPTASGSPMSLVSTDGVYNGTSRGMDSYITSGGDITWANMRSSTNVPSESVTWTVSLGGTNLTGWVNKWVGVAFAYNSGASQITLYLKDLSSASNPWVNQGTKNVTTGINLDCSTLAISCSIFPGNLIVGARANGTAAADQKFKGRISQFAAFQRVVDVAGINLYSQGTPAGADTPATPWVLTRVAEMSQTSDVTPSQLVTVAEGSTNADSIWQLTTDAPITLNTTSLSFARKDGLSQTAADGLVPPGTVVATARTSAPSGYLMAQGQAVSRTTYPDLFTAIGTTYGSGDGSTTFNLPDLRGRVPVGVSGTFAIGSTGGEQNHTLSQNELPAVNLSVAGSASVNVNVNTTVTPNNGYWYWSYGGGGCSGCNSVMTWTPGVYAGQEAGLGTFAGSGSGSGSISGWTSNLGSGGSFTNMQPYVALNYMIKY